MPISYTLEDSTFLIINQLLMIQPVTLTVGKEVVGQLWLNDKSTDFFDMYHFIHKDYPVPSGILTCIMLIGMLTSSSLKVH